MASGQITEMYRRAAFLLGLILLVVASPQVAVACSPGLVTRVGMLKSSERMFAGRVLSIEPSANSYGSAVSLEVLRTWKGDVPANVVITFVDPGSCGRDQPVVRQGADYVVWANESEVGGLVGIGKEVADPGSTAEIFFLDHQLPVPVAVLIGPFVGALGLLVARRSALAWPLVPHALLLRLAAFLAVTALTLGLASSRLPEDIWWPFSILSFAIWVLAWFVGGAGLRPRGSAIRGLVLGVILYLVVGAGWTLGAILYQGEYGRLLSNLSLVWPPFWPLLSVLALRRGLDG